MFCLSSDKYMCECVCGVCVFLYMYVCVFQIVLRNSAKVAYKFWF